MRPSKYTTDLGDDICRRLAAGESARQICRDDAMPAMSTLMKWLTDSDKVTFSEQYARARDCQADYYADQIVDIADELSEAAEASELARAKLQIDSRKWKVARMSPRKYGDKQQIDHTSSDDAFKPTVIKLVAQSNESDWYSRD